MGQTIDIYLAVATLRSSPWLTVWLIFMMSMGQTNIVRV